eukprot:659646-Pyramimonas_sp.AAC.1
MREARVWHCRARVWVFAHCPESFTSVKLVTKSPLRMIAEAALAAGRVSALKLAGWGPHGPRPKGPETRPAGPLKPLEPQPKSPDPDDL